MDDENSSLDSEEDDVKVNDVGELTLHPCSTQSTISNDVEVDDRVSLEDYYSLDREKLKRINHVHEKQDHRGGRSLNVDACKEIIDPYMKNLDSLPTEEEPYQ
ncbi:chromatin remodeling complex subunit, partial [Trifolium pratense]